MKRTLSGIVSLVLVGIVLLTGLSGCLYAARYDRAVKGKVVDVDTGEPIEGVVILAEWRKGRPTVAGEASFYYDAREDVTDENGEFYIPGKKLRIMTGLKLPSISVVKAGYRVIIGEHETKRTIKLKKVPLGYRKKRSPFPPPPGEAPFEKVKHYLKEIDKDSIERGLKPRGIWGGVKYD